MTFAICYQVDGEEHWDNNDNEDLEGITRWNIARGSAAIEGSEGTLRTFDIRLQEKVNSLSRRVTGADVFPFHQPPMGYTGELFGVEYLYSQSSQVMDTQDLDTQIDERFEDIDEEDLVHVSIVFKPHVQKPSRGRFAQKKHHREGYISVESMKR